MLCILKALYKAAPLIANAQKIYKLDPFAQYICIVCYTLYLPLIYSFETQASKQLVITSRLRNEKKTDRIKESKMKNIFLLLVSSNLIPT